jgi:tetratricopeptide (TPR) repeat protein
MLRAPQNPELEVPKEKVMELIISGDYKQAYALFSQITEKYPEAMANAYGLIIQGSLSYLNGDFERALSAFLEAKDKDPENPDINVYIGITYGALGQKEKVVEYLPEAPKIYREKFDFLKILLIEDFLKHQ